MHARLCTLSQFRQSWRSGHSHQLCGLVLRPAVAPDIVAWHLTFQHIGRGARVCGEAAAVGLKVDVPHTCVTSRRPRTLWRQETNGLATQGGMRERIRNWQDKAVPDAEVRAKSCKIAVAAAVGYMRRPDADRVGAARRAQVDTCSDNRSRWDLLATSP